MRRSARWLRPVLAGLLAAVLAIAGVVVGTRFAAPVTVAASTLVDAAVLQPLAIGGAPESLEAVDPLLTGQVSTGSTRVVKGFDLEGYETRLGEYLDAVSVLPDPSTSELVPLFSESEGGDGCAVVEGSDELDCPEGLEGAIFRDTAAYPPARVRAAFMPTSGCPTPFSEPGATWLRVDSNRPVTITVAYWSATDPTAAPMYVESSTLAADEAAWRAAIEASDPTLHGWPTITTCVRLDGVVPDQAYSANVGVSAEDDTADSRLVTFNSSGSPVVPRAFIYTPTDDLVIATVPHRPLETVETFVDITVEGETPACDFVESDADGAALHLDVDRQVSVSPTQLAIENIDAAYTLRTTHAWSLNEGETALVCARVLPAGGGAPTYQASAVVQTADRLLPHVSVWGVSIRDGASLSNGLWIRGYLPRGEQCDHWEAPSAVLAPGASTILSDPWDVCRFAALRGSGGATTTVDADGIPYSYGTTPRFTVVWDELDGATEQPTFSLDLGSMASCRGVCAEPADSFFVLDAPGSGYAVMHVEWEQYSTNGAATTTVGVLSDSLTAAAELPMLTGGSLIQTDVDVVALSADAVLTLASDRPATYTARLTATPGNDNLCYRPGAVFEAAGSVGVPATFTGLCLGASYDAVVTLTGGGATSTWQPTPSTLRGGTWLGGRLHVTAREFPLTLSYTASNDSGAPDLAALLTVRANGALVIGPGEYSCFGTTASLSAPETVVAVPASDSIRITGELIAVDGSTGSGARCTLGARDPSRIPTTFSIELSLDDLLASPSGVVVAIEPVTRPAPFSSAISGTLSISVSR